jgi:hypothetical protein
MPDKPWEEVGISRATWYRQGKPKSKRYRITQAQKATIAGVSVRSIQRASRILREAPELSDQISGGILSLGLAEKMLRQ